MALVENVYMRIVDVVRVDGGVEGVHIEGGFFDF